MITPKMQVTAGPIFQAPPGHVQTGKEQEFQLSTSCPTLLKKIINTPKIPMQVAVSATFITSSGR